MLKSTIPASEGTLFETTLEPASAVIDMLRTEKGFEGESEMKGFHGGINKVTVGYPYSEVKKYVNSSSTDWCG